MSHRKLRWLILLPSWITVQLFMRGSRHVSERTVSEPLCQQNIVIARQYEFGWNIHWQKGPQNVAALHYSLPYMRLNPGNVRLTQLTNSCSLRLTDSLIVVIINIYKSITLSICKKRPWNISISKFKFNGIHVTMPSNYIASRTFWY